MYEISIKRKDPYNVKTLMYEASDGKLYSTAYAVPDGMEYKTVEIEAGEIAYNSTTVLTQEVEALDLKSVIKAINELE